MSEKIFVEEKHKTYLRRRKNGIPWTNPWTKIVHEGTKYSTIRENYAV